MISSEFFQSLITNISSICNNKTHHPKLSKLLELLSQYFLSPDTIQNNSKVIIFTQSRDTAYEISTYLNSHNPRIISSIFIGQSGRLSKKKTTDPSFKNPGMSHKQQISTIVEFKANKINTIIATCIGEEGLDIGDVDLIICYDSGFSPIRMIQRKGRTGRHRNGKVIMLLMEGKENNSYMQNVKKSEGLIKSLKKCSVFNENKDKKCARKMDSLIFYPFNPRMIPEGHDPKLEVKENLLENDEDEKEEENIIKDKSKEEGFEVKKKKKYIKKKKKEVIVEEIEVNLIDEKIMNVSNIDENTRITENDEGNDEVLDEKKWEQEILEIDPDNEELNFERMERELEKILIDTNCKASCAKEIIVEEYKDIYKGNQENNKNQDNVIENSFCNKADELNHENEYRDSNELSSENKQISESFDSEIEKAIDNILDTYENSQLKIKENEENEDEDLILLESLLSEYEQNDKKRKISIPDKNYLKKIKLV